MPIPLPDKTHRHRSAFEPNMEWDLERSYNGLITDLERTYEGGPSYCSPCVGLFFVIAITYPPSLIIHQPSPNTYHSIYSVCFKSIN